MNLIKMTNGYIHDITAERALEKGLAKEIIDNHKALPFFSRMKDNFSAKIWKSRFEYYIEYVSAPNIPLTH